MSRAAVLALGIMSLLPACGTAPGQQAAVGAKTAAASCGASVHYLVTADSAQFYIEAPAILEKLGDLVFLGSPAVAVSLTADRTSLRASDSLIGARLSRKGITAIPRPSPDSLDISRAAVTPDGQVTLLWGHEDSLTRQTNIMWSELRADHWVEPKAIPGTTDLNIWRTNLVSRPATIDRTVVLAAAPGADQRDHARILYWDKQGWASRPLKDHHQLYSSITQAGNGDWVMGYVDYGEPDGNTVYARRSTDHGATWLLPLRISEPRTGPAFDVDIVSLGGNRLAIVWGAGGGMLQNEVRISISNDAGRTWESQLPWRASGGIVSVRSVAAGRDRVGVAVQAMRTNGAGGPHYLEWSDGWRNAWVAPDSIRSFGVTTIARISNGTVLAWGQTRSLAGKRIPVTAYLRYPDCASGR
jgi:hypothetical protein